MILDNSMVSAWSTCPALYFERYDDGQSASPIGGTEARDFGSRFHQLLEAHYTGKPAPETRWPELEDEAQATLAAYIAYYPVEPFDVVETERVHVLPIPGSNHQLAVKLDDLIRQRDDRALRVFDTKTERRGSQSNHPDSWASRRQVGLYQWAARQYSAEEVTSIVINIVTRQSEKGRVSPSFSRLETYRTEAQQQEALRYVTWVGDQIERARETGYYPMNRDACKDGWKKCDFYTPHLYGWTDALRAKYTAKEDYLGLDKK